MTLFHAAESSIPATMKSATRNNRPERSGGRPIAGCASLELWRGMEIVTVV